MTRITIAALRARRETNTPFSCLTAYDATFARIASDAGIEVLLVGDSLGMVLQGHPSTLQVTMDDMAYHTACVTRAGVHSLIMADMPFMSNACMSALLENAGRLMRAGAHMVKLEGEAWLAEGVRELALRGIPTCVHMGLTPQSVNAFGGYKVQGRDAVQAERIIKEAQQLADAGAAVILLECVPAQLGRAVRNAIDIPVIGIGAGPDVDGQILVMHDMLGANVSRPPRFVKDFLKETGTIESAFKAYREAVAQRSFPASEHCF
ncbi:3-methyl-2-oxobutanoate hydroxymethyltransferase [Phytohalomonas tamaricis]|uniref:3-methyl-2-oxobutanoate hydroxymethyltransferase n=1 Tax=Phytohalomonas tamaricis TaxID=2081032 RepID=UPI000D0AC2BA|nr:3-methyl-2-oxobutanoate hydroxymethyltransferase [Phytohalomonas tamaricis]